MTDPSAFAHCSPARANDALPQEGEPYAILFEHGTLQVGWYAPRGSDEQTPHERDEVYVVAAGRARFGIDEQDDRPVASGDLLFVAAGRAHRFAGMSDDFATWVLFYGPAGGE